MEGAVSIIIGQHWSSRYLEGYNYETANYSLERLRSSKLRGVLRQRLQQQPLWAKRYLPVIFVRECNFFASARLLDER